MKLCNANHRQSRNKEEIVDLLAVFLGTGTCVVSFRTIDDRMIKSRIALWTRKECIEPKSITDSNHFCRAQTLASRFCRVFAKRCTYVCILNQHWVIEFCSADTRCGANVALRLVSRLRRLTNVKATLAQHLLFAGLV